MCAYQALPGRGFLQRYLNDLKQQPFTIPGGAYQRQRMGQSLEFLEYQAYRPGDDIRYVDWRASQRNGGRHRIPSEGWLVRRFEAEERFRLVISMDTRPTMQAPDAGFKLQIARWLAESLGIIACREKHDVYFHALFESRPVEPVREATIRRVIERVAAPSELDADSSQETTAPAWRLNTRHLQQLLTPTAVWVIVSDYYFKHELQRQLARWLRRMNSGYRVILLFDIDSWQFEADYLGQGARNVYLNENRTDERRVFMSDTELEKVAARISRHKEGFFNRSRWSERSTWHIDPDVTTRDRLFGWFKEQFINEPAFRHLFRT